MKGEREIEVLLFTPKTAIARWTVLFRVNPVIDWIGRCAKQSPRHREFPSTRGHAEEEEEWWGNANLWRPSPPQLHNNLIIIIHKRATPSFASFTVSPGESTLANDSGVRAAADTRETTAGEPSVVCLNRLRITVDIPGGQRAMLMLIRETRQDNIAKPRL